MHMTTLNTESVTLQSITKEMYPRSPTVNPRTHLSHLLLALPRFPLFPSLPQCTTPHRTAPRSSRVDNDMTSVYPCRSIGNSATAVAGSPILSDFSGSESSCVTDSDSPLNDFDPFLIPLPFNRSPATTKMANRPDSSTNNDAVDGHINFTSSSIIRSLPSSSSCSQSLHNHTSTQIRSTLVETEGRLPNTGRALISIAPSDVTVPSFRFETERELKVGKEVAKRTRRFACTAKGCGKSFAKKWNLQAHERLHSGYKPFECRIGCGERHMWMSSLKSHERRKCKLLPESQRLRRKPRAKKTSTASTTNRTTTVTAPTASRLAQNPVALPLPQRTDRRVQAPSSEALFEFELELENIIAKY